MFDCPWIPHRYDEFVGRGLSEATLKLLHQDVQVGHGMMLVHLYGWCTELHGKNTEQALLYLEAKETNSEAVRFALCQYTNLNFFWLSMSPEGGCVPLGLARKLSDSFGSIDSFKREFRGQAARSTTPDWLWLIYETRSGTLAVTRSDHLRSPMTDKTVLPLMCCTLAEHAYLLDYGLNRDAYICNWLDHIANYRFAEERLGALN